MPSSLAGSQPLHDQVRETIAAQIRSGAIPPGARLQSERDLADQMGVSRVTVRRALDALAEDGLVRAARGSGRFVSDAALAEPPNALLSFTELGAERGLEATSRVLGAQRPPRHVRGGRASSGWRPGRTSSSSTVCGCSTEWRSRSTQPAFRSSCAPELPTIDFSTASLYAVLDAAGASARSCRLHHRGRRRRCRAGTATGGHTGEPTAPREDDELRRIRSGRRAR